MSRRRRVVVFGAMAAAGPGPAANPVSGICGDRDRVRFGRSADPEGGGIRVRAGGLPVPAFAPLELGTVRPAGWLRDQLTIQAEGLTGHLGEYWSDCGPTSAWRGGDGEAWERGPYYLDGLVPLAHLLDDGRLHAIAEPFIEWILDSARADGLFGPANNEDWWPRMVACKVLTGHAEATGDPRVLPFLLAYFRHQLAALPGRPLSDWGQARAADNVLSVYWAYARSGEAFLLELAALLLGQGIDWPALWADFPYRVPQTTWTHRAHVVNVAMGLKFPALRLGLTHDLPRARAEVATGLETIWRHHGQAHGMFSGDEWLAGTDPVRGVETCAVVEAMFSFEVLLAALGDAHLGDHLERIAYNALPACQTPDLWLHQYDQQANQVQCTRERRPGWSNAERANLFGLEPHFGCCTANLHQGWPKFVAHLWGRAPDGGLAVLAYGPSSVEVRVPGGRITIEEQTDYPFRDTVHFSVRPSRPGLRCPLHLRVPAWTEGRGRCCIGVGEPEGLGGGGWHVVDRAWLPGDTIRVELPAAVERVHRPSGGISVRRGPIVFVQAIPERWERLDGRDPVAEYAVLPGGAWNYGLVADAPLAPSHHPVPRQPFAAGVAPLRLETQGRQVAGWGLDGPSAGPVPGSPAAATESVEPLTLVPYGSARLRVTEMPEVLA